MNPLRRTHHHRLSSIIISLVVTGILSMTVGVLGLIAIAQHALPASISSTWMMILVIAGVIMAIIGFGVSTGHGRATSSPIERMAAITQRQAKRDTKQYFGRNPRHRALPRRI